MSFPSFECLSPNRDRAPPHERLGVLFHHSELDFYATLERMIQPESKVSYHCLIGPGGMRGTLVADSEIAWHAGASHFLGRERCNDFLLGVAFAGDTDLAPLTESQIASALEWLDGRWQEYGWDLSRMTDHRQVSPGRKRDLNPAQWDRLQAAIAGQFTR